MSKKDTGFDDLMKQLNKMETAAKELDGTHDVNIEEVFDIKFMRKYTTYDDFDAFLVGGGFKVESQQDFEELPEDQLDSYIQRTTKFDSWQSMLSEATEQYVVKKLGF